MSAMGSPAGPAHISIPRDVMAMDATVTQTNYQLNTLLDKPELIDDHAVEQQFHEVKEAKNPPEPEFQGKSFLKQLLCNAL